MAKGERRQSLLKMIENLSDLDHEDIPEGIKELENNVSSWVNDIEDELITIADYMDINGISNIGDIEDAYKKIEALRDELY